jgi:hypothetical protein
MCSRSSSVPGAGNAGACRHVPGDEMPRWALNEAAFSQLRPQTANHADVGISDAGLVGNYIRRSPPCHSGGGQICVPFWRCEGSAGLTGHSSQGQIRALITHPPAPFSGVLTISSSAPISCSCPSHFAVSGTSISRCSLAPPEMQGFRLAFRAKTQDPLAPGFTR